MVYRLILPEYARIANPDLRTVLEGEFTEEEVQKLNQVGYNIYWLPNGPKIYDKSRTVDGTDIDVFKYVFVDFDLKSGTYPSKDAFLTKLNNSFITPTMTVDSGNGIHAYWEVSDLDAMAFLRLQRRLIRFFNTDDAVAKIFQLMRWPGTYNTKAEGNPKPCEVIGSDEVVYTSEQLDRLLPPITKDDEDFCQGHYSRTHKLEQKIDIDDTLPHKFMKLLKSSREVKQLYAGTGADRSGDDYRLAHILFAEGFTKKEALSVLVNCRKAVDRSPIHRQNYALNIADKIWQFENGDSASISNSVLDILKRGTVNQGERLPCWDLLDGTKHGFRLTQVLGLIGATGSGKTTLALNYFYWFAKLNPQYIHLFVSLEQPEEEIAARWAKIAGDNESLHSKVHVLSNYNEDGSYRNLSLSEIEDHVLKMKEQLGVQVGCVVIDHVGVLKKEGKNGENQGLIDVFHGMKAFAKRTNTFLVMQSQTSREKGGLGDVELERDAAYGSSMFEWYADYIFTTHQPLKRVYYKAPHMTVTCLKACKIRHKNVSKDRIQEDNVYAFMFDIETEQLREMTDDEMKSYEFLAKEANVVRNKDRRREPTQITRLPKLGTEGATDNGATTRTADKGRVKNPTRVLSG